MSNRNSCYEYICYYLLAMKILGLIGGTSWVSTVDYYCYINQGINEKLGGLNYAHCMIYSFNYADIVRNNENENWDATLMMVTKAAINMKQGGAGAIVLCANTMHIIADELEKNVGLPVIHIASATAAAISKQNISKVGLLGTRFTMERDFFKNKLKEQGIVALVPDDDERKFIHDTIGNELGRGILKPETKSYYLEVILKLINKGAEGIILACTEIPMLIKTQDTDIPLFDTTLIHAKAAIEFAVS
jgi:aspartate racemase